VQAAVGHSQLSVNGDGPRYTPAIKSIRKIPEQRALSDTGLAAEYKDPALALQYLSQEPVERGAFGSPTFFVGKEIFFGKEQLREVEELISGK